MSGEWIKGKDACRHLQVISKSRCAPDSQIPARPLYYGRNDGIRQSDPTQDHTFTAFFASAGEKITQRPSERRVIRQGERSDFVWEY